MRRPSCVVLVLAATLLTLAGCGAPMQEGGVVVADGAGARLLMAMRFGYAAVGEAVRPADVRRAIYREQLPTGARASGRLGDYVLDNGIVGVVVANVDGTARSGKLVDLARWGGSGDELEGLDTRVLGVPVRYDTLKTGYDEALGAAYVSVTGTVRPSDGSEASVETRYDLAPGLDTVLVTTRVEIKRAPNAPTRAPAADEPLTSTSDAAVSEADLAAPHDSAAPLVEDRVPVKSARAIVADPRGPFVAAFGDAAGYALQPAGEGQLADDAIAVPSARTPGVGGSFLYSRTLTALERPDTLAAEVAYARTLGEPLGELEVTLDTPDVDPSGELVLTRAPSAKLTALAIPACGTPRAYRVKVPAGVYAVTFRSARITSARSSEARVERERVAFVRVPTRASDAPFAEPLHAARCPAPEGVALSGP